MKNYKHLKQARSEFYQEKLFINTFLNRFNKLGGIYINNIYTK